MEMSSEVICLHCAHYNMLTGIRTAQSPIECITFAFENNIVVVSLKYFYSAAPVITTS